MIMARSPGSLGPSERSPLLRRESAAQGEDESPRPKIFLPRAVSVIFFFAVLIFLQSSNFSVMSTASTPVAEELKAYSDTSWFTSTYLIAMSSLSPLAGRLSQIFDPRNCAFTSGLIFATGSLIASQAHDFWFFLFGRAVQGMGAAGIYTLSVNLVIHLATKERRGLFIGAANSAITLGVSLGAVIGGEFVVSIGWRPLFWLQTPIALVSAICLHFCIPSIKEMQQDQNRSMRQKLSSIDYIGSVLLVTTLTSLLFGLANSEILVLPILIALALLILFILQELYRASSPVIPLTVLSSRGVLLSCLAQLLFMTTRWCVLFYSPIYTLAVRDWPPATAGAILIPTNVGFALGGLVVGWLHIRRGGSYYASTLVCMICFPLTVVVLSYLATPISPTVLYIVIVFLNGSLAGATLNYGLAHLLHISDPSTHFVSTALLATARGFAGSFGAGIGGGLFARTLKYGLEKGFERKRMTGPDVEKLIERLLGSPAIVGDLTGTQHDVAVNAYANAIQTLFYVFSALAVGAVLMQAGTGWSAWEERRRRGVWWREMWRKGRKWLGKGEEEEEDL